MEEAEAFSAGEEALVGRTRNRPLDRSAGRVAGERPIRALQKGGKAGRRDDDAAHAVTPREVGTLGDPFEMDDRGPAAHERAKTIAKAPLPRALRLVEPLVAP